jgi:hypothetical protein
MVADSGTTSFGVVELTETTRTVSTCAGWMNGLASTKYVLVNYTYGAIVLAASMVVKCR